jgi:hypothetical protein
MRFCASIVPTALVLALTAIGPICAIGDEPDPKANDAVQAKIDKALDTRFDLDFKNTPLSQVADHLKQQLGIDVRLAKHDLAMIGIPEDMPVSLIVKNMRARSALYHLLHTLDLDWYADDGALVITSTLSCEWPFSRVYEVNDVVRVKPRDAPVHLATRVGVVDLTALERKPPSDGRLDRERFVALARSIVSPDSWEAVGGPAVVRFAGEMAVVSQEERGHVEITSLLALLRELKRQDQLPRGKQKFALSAFSNSDEGRIYDALEAMQPVGLDDLALADAAQKLGDQFKVNVLIDQRALDAAGIDEKRLVRLPAGEWPLRFALRKMIESMDDGLGWAIDHDALVLTYRWNSDLQLRAYRVRDLLGVAEAAPPEEISEALDELTQTLIRVVAPDSWEAAGGPGTVFALPERGALIASCSTEVHQWLDSVLADLRRKAVAGKPANGAESPPLAVANQPLRLLVYNLTTSEDGKAVVSPLELAEVVSELIEPKSWQETEGACLRGVGNSLVVRAAPSVHRKIQRLLEAIDALPRAKKADHDPFGRSP